MESTVLLALLSQYPITASVMTNLTRQDLINLLEAFGGHWSEKIGQEVTWKTMKRLVRCDRYGLREVESTLATNRLWPPTQCSTTQKACETCGWTTCRNCMVTPTRAFLLLGYNYYRSSSWTLCHAQSFRCETCRPPSGKSDCSCSPNPVIWRYGRGKHTCFYCLHDDWKNASLGPFCYEHQLHHRGYFQTESERGDAKLQVANCGDCEARAREVVLRGWCVYCGGLAENKRLDEANSQIRKDEDYNGDDDDDGDDEEGEEDYRSDADEEAHGDARNGRNRLQPNKGQNYVDTAEDIHGHSQKRRKLS